MSEKTSLKCSFCGKSTEQVKKLISGPGTYICNECVDLCNEILTDDGFSGLDTSTILKLQSVGPSRLARPHPLETVPEQLISSAIECVQSLIEAYDACGRTVDAEPLIRVLLGLQEYEMGSLDARLLPILEKLSNTYLLRRQYQCCLAALEWRLSIVDANHAQKPKQNDLLISLAKMHIRLGNDNQAEEILDRIHHVQQA